MSCCSALFPPCLCRTKRVRDIEDADPERLDLGSSETRRAISSFHTAGPRDRGIAMKHPALLENAQLTQYRRNAAAAAAA
ncbi:hypothetical protein AC579_10392 [Pseudocercospora musae]|uniref:Uncharacterized protein n=1 Tax=Pseudocercospora musae TaxID=113226 RepID=A0A139IC25_9PEZI|nr:hypothetical protein AC579_10392 [Pseudocercospora musae]